MKHNRETLNPYKITWLAFVPASGRNVVTLRDQQMINRSKCFMRKGEAVIFEHFASTSKASEAINRLAGKLSKKYKVYQFTDKQFSMLKFGQDFSEVLTTKQMHDACVIG